MKRLKDFINEALRGEVHKWIEQIYNNMKSLFIDNKTEPIDINIDNLNKPAKGGFKFDDFSSDNIIKNILKDKFIGFEITNQIINTPNKYLINNEEEKTLLKPECLPYWYVEETENKDTQRIYFIGLILFDTTTNYIEDYCNIISIETSKCVNNSLEVQKAMLNDFLLHYLNKKGKYEGLATEPVHPKLKGIFTRLGFKTLSENKNILTYKA